LGWTAQVGRQLRDPDHPDYGFFVSDEIFSWIGSSINIGELLIIPSILQLLQLEVSKKNGHVSNSNETSLKMNIGPF
jgi:hypothetical protein